MSSTSAAASAAASSSNASNTSPDESPVLFESAYSTRTFILNRPKALNALDIEMINMIMPKIAEWNKSDLCKIIISRGNGRAYCAGGEVKSIVKNAAKPETRQKALDYFQNEFQLDYNLATLDKPYVSIMDGITFGGGVGLSAYAPFRIATPRTLFAMPETKIGYAPDVGSTYALARLDGEIGTYLALTGNTLTGEETFRLGLATHFVESSRIPALLERLASLENPERSYINAAIEEFSQDVDGATLGAKERAPPSIIVGETRKALDFAFSAPNVETIFERLEGLAAETNEKTSNVVKSWAKETINTLKLRSPTSLKVSLVAVRNAGRDGFRLSDSFQMELGIATAFCSGASPDFITGVNAVLVEKTKERPKWSPSTVTEVANSDINENFFSPTSQYLKLAPRLKSSDRTDADTDLSFWALPRERAVRALVMGEAKDSGKHALNLDLLVQKFERRTKNKIGLRAKIEEIVNRCCEADENGWLKWTA